MMSLQPPGPATPLGERLKSPAPVLDAMQAIAVLCLGEVAPVLPQERALTTLDAPIAVALGLLKTFSVTALTKTCKPNPK